MSAIHPDVQRLMTMIDSVFRGFDWGKEIDALAASISARLLAEDEVAVKVDDLSEILDACGYMTEPGRAEHYFWEKWGYQENYDRLSVALAARSDGPHADNENAPGEQSGA